jgi:hypothetical protein
MNVLEIIVVAGGAVGLFMTLTNMKKQTLGLAAGLCVGIPITLFTKYDEVGVAVYCVFLILTAIHAVTKISDLGTKIALAASSGAMAYHWVWHLLHLKGNTLIGVLLALAAVCFSLISKPSKAYTGILIIIAADAFARLLEWAL